MAENDETNDNYDGPPEDLVALPLKKVEAEYAKVQERLVEDHARARDLKAVLDLHVERDRMAAAMGIDPEAVDLPMLRGLLKLRAASPALPPGSAVAETNFLTTAAESNGEEGTK